MYVQMPPQVYAGEEPPHQSMMQPVSNDTSMHWKPQGGLWTSSHQPNSDHASEWLEWCDGEKFRQEKYRRAWLLQPAGAWMAVVRTPEDLEDLRRQYDMEYPDDWPVLRMMRDRLDYEKLAENYDGLWLPNPYPYRLSGDTLFFNVFDVESTIWFRWNFLGEPVEI